MAQQRPSEFTHTPAPAPAAGGLQGLLTTNVQRVGRVVTFADELVRQHRREFAALWLPDGLPATLAPEAKESLAMFARRVDRLTEKANEGRQLLDEVQSLRLPDALAALNRFDTDGLTALARGLEPAANQARAALTGRPVAAGPLSQARAPGTAPLGPAPTAPLPKQGGLVGMLRKLADPVAAETLSEAAPPPPDPARQAFEAARTFVSEVLSYVSPRLGLVKFALDATGLPGRKRAWGEITQTLLPSAQAAGIEREQMAWLPPMTKLFYEDMGATQKAHVATVQWGEATTLDDEAALLASTLESAPPERRPGLLGAFNVGKYRAAIFPLSHLHMSFRGVRHLQELFPAPASGGTGTLRAGFQA